MNREVLIAYRYTRSGAHSPSGIGTRLVEVHKAIASLADIAELELFLQGDDADLHIDILAFTRLEEPEK